jgi:hypothetical protein
MTMTFRPRAQAAIVLLFLASSTQAIAGATTAPPSTMPGTTADGSHDFDFEFGTWKTHVRRLVRPLTGSTTWVEMDGITTVRRVWDGRANLIELVAHGSGGRFEGLNLRMYNPETKTWSLNFASSRDGMMTTPAVGRFRNGRGEFFSRETLDGHPILVRFVIFGITRTSCHFEQAFSVDDGKTWEINWVATDTRIPGAKAR